MLVDEFMAQQLWPNQDPLGKRISFGDLAARRFGPPWSGSLAGSNKKRWILIRALRFTCRKPVHRPPVEYCCAHHH